MKSCKDPGAKKIVMMWRFQHKHLFKNSSVYTVEPRYNKVALVTKILSLYPIFVIIKHGYRWKRNHNQVYAKELQAGLSRRASKGSPGDFGDLLTSCRDDMRYGRNNKLHTLSLHRRKYGTMRSVLLRGIGMLACWLQSNQVKPLSKTCTPPTDFLQAKEKTACGSELRCYSRQCSLCIWSHSRSPTRSTNVNVKSMQNPSSITFCPYKLIARASCCQPSPCIWSHDRLPIRCTSGNIKSGQKPSTLLVKGPLTRPQILVVYWK